MPKGDFDCAILKEAVNLGGIIIIDGRRHLIGSASIAGASVGPELIQTSATILLSCPSLSPRIARERITINSLAPFNPHVRATFPSSGSSVLTESPVIVTATRLCPSFSLDYSYLL